MAPSEEETGRGGGRRSAPEETADDGDVPMVPCHIFLPVVPAARVIGKGGASIRAIRDQSGADVKILQKELPLELQRREDRIVVITGSANSVRQAIGSVLERVFDRSGLPEDRRSGGGYVAQERPFILEVVVPEKSSPHLIGHRGERIRSLIEETRCDMNVGKELITGLVEQKKVRITGTSAEEVADAVWRLQEVLGELMAGGVLKTEHFDLRVSGSASQAPGTFASGASASVRSSSRAPSRGPPERERETPIRILVSKEEAAWVVGKRGHKITRLRDFAKVQMNDVDSPPFDATERVVEIALAPLEQRIRVVQMVIDDLALRPEAAGELRLLVPTEQFGSVMGHRGETIRGIMQSTGATLQQHKAEKLADGVGDYRLRLVEVRGDARQRVEAVRQIHHAIESRGGVDAATAGGTNGLGSRASTADLGLGSSPVVAGNSAGFSGAVGGAVPGTGPSFPSGGVLGVDRMGSGGAGGGGSTGVGGSTGLGSLLGLSAAGLGGSGLGGDAVPSGQVTLQLAMPSEEVAKVLASESSGIAWRAGVRLVAGRSAGGMPMLEVQGTAVGNAVACYLVQDRLFMMH